MFGVVLWSDPERRKAVIWCEDHRDLAYFDGAAEDAVDHGPNRETASVALGVGDMLLFDVCVSEQRRMAYNLKRVAVAAAEQLVQTMQFEGSKLRETKEMDATVVSLSAKRFEVDGDTFAACE